MTKHSEAKFVRVDIDEFNEVMKNASVSGNLPGFTWHVSEERMYFVNEECLLRDDGGSQIDLLEARVAELESKMSEVLPEFSSSVLSQTKLSEKGKTLRPFSDLVKVEDGDCAALRVARLAIFIEDKTEIKIDSSCSVVILHIDFPYGVRVYIYSDYQIFVVEKSSEKPANNQLKIFQLLHREGFINLEQ